MSGLRVCLVASSRHPIREPFAGGLESQTHYLARELRRRGHRVSLYAAPGSDPALGAVELDVDPFWPSDAACADVNAPPARWIAEHHAYLSLMLDLAGPRGATIDVVHNNSLHHLPVAMARTLSVPVVTTLHTPPLPWLESAFQLSPETPAVAVSETCRRMWAPRVRASVVRNGVDTAVWRAGPGGGPAVWTGRITAEKAPHEAALACRRAGVPLRLVGPVSDPDYFEACLRPLLDRDVEHLGHLPHDELVSVVGESSVALVTPRWEEPYGLVAAEAMSCGTPVAAYDRGAIAEVVTRDAGVVVPADDVDALAVAVLRAAALPRDVVRATAVRDCSLERMVDEYEELYRSLARAGRPAA
ncbi:Glycogen synthase [Nocardioides dokdonensis FR1436]|uniref:Glycogen synthase n=1 Tax=Nocardioides dokdonensis FR1436 TaxID=1300347 RepID=A0A1A9GKT6_9ACTN|nr:glycosyltransferase [Nocardioides dokdonensis]ANH38065.1 Glycogen synthase [Nocardioides dokdonensis FR1436]